MRRTDVIRMVSPVAGSAGETRSVCTRFGWPGTGTVTSRKGDEPGEEAASAQAASARQRTASRVMGGVRMPLDTPASAPGAVTELPSGQPHSVRAIERFKMLLGSPREAQNPYSSRQVGHMPCENSAEERSRT